MRLFIEHFEIHFVKKQSKEFLAFWVFIFGVIIAFKTSLRAKYL